MELSQVPLWERGIWTCRPQVGHISESPLKSPEVHGKEENFLFPFFPSQRRGSSDMEDGRL